MRNGVTSWKSLLFALRRYERKRLRSFRKQCLHPSPYRRKQLRIAIPLEAFGVRPVAESSIDQFVVQVSQQFKVDASAEISDSLAVSIEYLQKFLYASFGKMHANDSDDHMLEGGGGSSCLLIRK